jgi:RimJ/RimL family protein N-acetyltransferase
MKEYLLESDRCLMRKFSTDDATMLYHLNLHPDIIRFTTDPPFKDIIESADFIRNYNGYQPDGYGRMAVVRKKDLKPIGWCGLKYIPEEGEVDLGYRFLPEVWGEGYAPETGAVFLEYGFDSLNLSRIVARIHKENQRSVRVAQKLGMIYEKDLIYDGVGWMNYVKEN